MIANLIRNPNFQKAAMIAATASVLTLLAVTDKKSADTSAAKLENYLTKPMAPLPKAKDATGSDLEAYIKAELPALLPSSVSAKPLTP